MRPVATARGVLTLALLAAVAGCGSGAASSFVDPGVLADRLTAAENRGDVEASLALFAGDGVRTGVPGCDQSDCRGTDNLRSSFQREAQVYMVKIVALAGSTVHDNVATQVFEVRDTLVTASGATRIVVTVVFTERDGRIASEQVINDVADPQTATYVQYLKDHPLQQIAS